jgi:FkbM family methyltransferase
MSKDIYLLYDDHTKIKCYTECKCCNNIDFISKNIIKYKCWEPNITLIFNYILKKNINCVIFDIGCNIGYFSLLSSKYADIIYSFDANIRNIEYLKNSIILNNFNNIKSYCCAISNNNTDFFKTSIIHEHNIGSMRIENTNKNLSNINTIVLDEFIEKNNINNIDLIKIDIEGSELNCLLGLKNTLEKHIIKNIIVEITPSWGIDIAINILKLIKSYDYKLYDAGLNECGNYSENLDMINNILSNEITDIELYISNIPIQTNIWALYI